MMLSITSTKTTLPERSVSFQLRRGKESDLKARYVQLLGDETTANVAPTKMYSFFTHDEWLTVELRGRRLGTKMT